MFFYFKKILHFSACKTQLLSQNSKQKKILLRIIPSRIYELTITLRPIKVKITTSLSKLYIQQSFLMRYKHLITF
jgi:hypothetical protein